MGLESQRAKSQSTRYLQISQSQFEADLLIIPEIIALCVELVCFPWSRYVFPGASLYLFFSV